MNPSRHSTGPVCLISYHTQVLAAIAASTTYLPDWRQYTPAAPACISPRRARPTAKMPLREAPRQHSPRGMPRGRAWSQSPSGARHCPADTEAGRNSPTIPQTIPENPTNHQQRSVAEPEHEPWPARPQAWPPEATLIFSRPPLPHLSPETAPIGAAGAPRSVESDAYGATPGSSGERRARSSFRASSPPAYL